MALMDFKVFKSWQQRLRAIAGLFKYPIRNLKNVD